MKKLTITLLALMALTAIGQEFKLSTNFERPSVCIMVPLKEGAQTLDWKDHDWNAMKITSKLEPIVTKQKDGTWLITFKKEEK